jgi:hypothetical protein
MSALSEVKRQAEEEATHAVQRSLCLHSGMIPQAAQMAEGILGGPSMRERACRSADASSLNRSLLWRFTTIQTITINPKEPS